MAAELCQILGILVLWSHGGLLPLQDPQVKPWRPLTTKFDEVPFDDLATSNASGIHGKQNEPNVLCLVPRETMEWKFPKEDFVRTYEGWIGTNLVDEKKVNSSWIGANYSLDEENEQVLSSWVESDYLEYYLDKQFLGVNGWIGANYMVKNFMEMVIGLTYIVSYLMVKLIGVSFNVEYVLVNLTCSWIGINLVRLTNGWIGSNYMVDDDKVNFQGSWIGPSFIDEYGMVNFSGGWIGTNYMQKYVEVKFIEDDYNVDYINETFEVLHGVTGSMGWIGTSIGMAMWQSLDCTSWAMTWWSGVEQWWWSSW